MLRGLKSFFCLRKETKRINRYTHDAHHTQLLLHGHIVIAGLIMEIITLVDRYISAVSG